MERLKSIAVIFLLAAGVISPAVRAESVSSMLQQGLYAEETEGDLDKAMEIYQKIITRTDVYERVAAQARYQLGICYMKKGDHAKAAQIFQEVITDFPNQRVIAARARKQLKNVGPSTKKIVEQAVMTISTLADGDPRVAKAMATLEEIDEGEVIAELITFLDRDEATVRRSAIYILWKGNFDSIAPAAGKLTQLCSHKEDFTRGMAAIALGAGKVELSFDIIADMTLNDSSGYARRSAAYALGLFGDERAVPTLRKAAKDSDPLVAENARYMLSTLDISAQSETAEPVVVGTTPAIGTIDVSPSLDKLSVTFNQTMKNGGWAWVRWEDPYPDTTGKPSYDSQLKTCTLPVKLKPGQAYLVAFNTDPYIGFRSASGVAAKPYVLVFATKDKNGKPTPIPQRMLDKAERVNSLLVEPSYVQQTYNDIQPDGTIKSTITIREKNRSADTIKTKNFINSDFVKVTAMHDGKGRPIEFTSTHSGNIYRYNATFNEPILPGQTIVYSHEATMTGLINPVPGKEQQFRYFMVHSPGADVPTQRIETYLLPAGAELVSTNPTTMQRSDKDGRIQLHIEKLIEPGGNIVTGFQYRLPRVRITQQQKMASENLASQGWELWKQRKLTEAEEKFKEAVAKDPTNDNAYQGLGWAQLNQGKKLNAKNSFEKCVRLNLKNSAALNGLGWIAHGAGNIDEAIRWWQKAIKVSKGGATASLSGLTQVYMERKEYDKAIKYYRMWLKAEPDNKQAKDGLEKAKAAPATKPDSGGTKEALSQPVQSRSAWPNIIRTYPAAFANDVPASLRKITVTFDRRMKDRTWSWTGGGETFPEIAGDIHYDTGKKTCTLPCKLEPGKVYWVGINSPNHKNFKSTDNIPAKRYVILFATKGVDGAATKISADMLKRAKKINPKLRPEPGVTKPRPGSISELSRDDGKSANKRSRKRIFMFGYAMKILRYLRISRFHIRNFEKEIPNG